MLSSFRNFTKSRIGLVVIFMVLGVVALAFAMGDVTGLSQYSGTSSRTIATVGGRKVTDTQVREQIERTLAAAQRAGQPIDMKAVIASGDFDRLIDQIIDNEVLAEFAQKNGMAVSDALVDGEIASAPTMLGPDGKFDQAKFDNWLREQRLSLQTFRQEFKKGRYGEWLLAPVNAATALPNSILAPYAALRLERRKFKIGIVRWNDMPDVADPDNKALTAFYAANRARYTVPERRVIRYAVVKMDDLKARSAATEGEIAEAYAKAGTRFAATEKRSVRQLVVADQATANAVAAEAKAGKSLDDQAKARGLQAAHFDSLEKPALARQTSDAIANAAFAAPQGGIVGPVQSPLGWVVVQVEKVEKIAARSLADARADLATEISTRKTMATLVALRQKVEDGIGGGATFDELLKANGLAAQTLGPVAATGIDPLTPDAKPDPALAGIVQAGFAVQPGDDAQVAPIGEDGSFAVVAPQRVIAAAPRPINEIRKGVIYDYKVSERLKKARAVAVDIVKQINAGQPFDQVMASHGATKLAPQSFDHRRIDFQGKPMPPIINMAFSIAAKKARFVPVEDRGGYRIVYVESIEPGDATQQPAVLAQARGELLQVSGRESAMQFLAAVRSNVGIKRNQAAIDALKASYTSANGRSGS